MRAFLPVGVEYGHDVDVESVDEVPVAVVVLHQLGHDEGHGGWGDPLAGVDAAVDPDGLLQEVARPADLHDPKDTRATGLHFTLAISILLLGFGHALQSIGSRVELCRLK